MIRSRRERTWLPYWIATIGLPIILAITAPVRAGDIFPRDQILFPFLPAAMADGPGGLRLNPAVIGADPEFALNYYHAFSDSSLKGDDAVYTTFRGFGFGIEWLGAGAVPDGRSYTIGLATSSQKSFAVGSSYQWRTSDDPVQDKAHFWTYGFLWRPNNTLSFAGVAHNYHRMKVPSGRSDAEFVYSAAVRLLQGRLLIGGDWYQTTSQRVKDGTYRLATSFQVRRGLTIYGDLDENENYFLGARVEMSTWFAGTHAAFDGERDYRGGVGYVGMHKTRRAPLWSLWREAAKIELAGAIPDRPTPRNFFGPEPATTFDYLSMLDKARRDPEIRAVLLRINDPELGWARREEIRRAILRVRDAGKPVIACVDGMVSNGEYYLASAADRIVAPPVSTIDVIGLRSEVTFAKRLLDKLGIVADLEHVGDYKNASDLLTRTSMSPAHREAVTALLNDLDGYWVERLAEGRRTAPDVVRGWIDHGPYVSVDAQAAGLIDTVAYADELDGIVSALAGPIWRTVGTAALRDRVYARSGWAEPDRVAVIFAEGGIEEGANRDDFLFGEVMGSATTAHAIQSARENPRVKALVLRVNSGGGSVVASDEIWREVARTVGRKPIIVSFADVAASGGYYIACAADSIFALPNTITGSIGVISGKLDFSALYDKVGLDKEAIDRGRFAGLYTSDGAFTDEQRAVIRAQMLRAYEHFKGLVAEGRSLPADSVEAIAQGRVWSGLAADRRGLVDGFADLNECITTAARMAGIDRGSDVEVMVLPERRWQLFDAGPIGFAGAFLPAETVEHLLATVLARAGLAPDNGLSYATPYRVTIR
ncbi:MAG TPA: signal peptide peptidase SppA [bacterium]|nr:signal peptide peptidase SppA [bacterium]